MKTTVIATYRRESTLWKNANAFYKMRDWTEMNCSVYDFSEELENIEEIGLRWTDINGNDVTEREIERRYGKPYAVTFVNKTGTNEETHSFKTKSEANEFVKSVLTDKILGNFKRVK